MPLRTIPFLAPRGPWPIRAARVSLAREQRLRRASRCAPKVSIFFDNDFLGPGQSNIQSLIPLLRDERVKLMGVGVVTGDAWMTEETAHALRFLEIAKRPDVPIHPGAEMPLMRTQAEMANWEARYGRCPSRAPGARRVRAAAITPRIRR
jgi:hypothetical protein